MNEKLQIVLADLANKFGTTVEHLWGVLLYQARISAISDAVILVFLIAITVAFYKYFRWYISKEKDNNDDFSEMLHIICLLCGALLVITFLFPMLCYNILTGILNPEYWALKQILK